MKIWCFYLFDNRQTDSRYYPNIKREELRIEKGMMYSLYAFTPTKSCADYFWKTRDHRLFYKKVIDIERDEYEDFCEEYGDHLLEFHHFLTKVQDAHGNVAEETVGVLCTIVESDSILYYKEDHMDKILANGMSMLYTFTNAKSILVPELYNLLNDYFEIDMILNVLYPYDEDITTSSYYPYDIDEVLLYCALYGTTFSNSTKVPVVKEIRPKYQDWPSI